MTRPAAEFDVRLEQAKLDAMKELAYGASHEINNPLANISARAQTLLRDETDPERRRALAAIDAQALRAHEMISDLMLFARPPALVLDDIDLVELAEEICRQSQDLCGERCIELAIQGDPQIKPIRADASQLAVALTAIVRNSIEAIGADGKISLSIERADAKSVRVVIEDNGPGIPDRVRSHAFDPFYSGREAGRGLGFGLAKCWRIVTEHGGSVTLKRRQEGGTRAELELPRLGPSDERDGRH